MLDRLQRLLRAFTPGSASRPAVVFDDDDHRLAAAGLLVHAMNADGVASEAERARLQTLLQQRFSLDARETQALIEAAAAKDREAIDLDGFTAVVRRAYTPDGRKRIIEMMWDVVFADGVLHEFEDAIVWRAADMIGVPATQRILIRKSVAAQRGIAVEGTGE